MNGVKLGTAKILQDPGGSGALDVPGRMLCGSAKAQRKRQPKARELMAQLRQMLQVTSKYAMWNPKLAAFNMIFIREKPILWGFHVGFPVAAPRKPLALKNAGVVGFQVLCNVRFEPRLRK